MGRVLIVHPDPALAAQVGAGLERVGLSCTWTVDGIEAAGRALARPFDVTVLDARVDLGVLRAMRLAPEKALETSLVLLGGADLDDLAPESRLDGSPAADQVVQEAQRLLRTASRPPARAFSGTWRTSARGPCAGRCTSPAGAAS